jgi:hypothetical protein
MNIIGKMNSFVIQRAYAGSLGKELEDKLIETTESTGTDDLINNILSFAIPLSVVCVVVLVVYAGYLLMSSQGNPDKLQEGKEIITNALIGFAIVLLSVAILFLLSNTLGIDISGY